MYRERNSACNNSGQPVLQYNGVSSYSFTVAYTSCSVTSRYLAAGQLGTELQSGRWQAPAAVLPPEGWQRARGPEGPEDKGHGHSRARRAREWPKHASLRARGRAKRSARLGACQCYYMFFTTQLKIAKFMGRFQDLYVGQKS